MYRSLQKKIKIVKNSFNYYISEIKRTNRFQCILTLTPKSEKKLRFKAGQYAKFSFEGKAAIPLSIASDPSIQKIELHINRIKRSLQNKYFKKHNKVLIFGPYGSSYLRKRRNKTIIGIAGGTGLAPIKSITETYLNQGGKNQIHLYHGVKNEKNLYLEKYFRSLTKKYKNLRYTPTLLNPTGKTKKRIGYVTDVVCHDFKDFREIICYLAGPKLMVESAFQLLTKYGAKRKNIFSDQINE